MSNHIDTWVLCQEWIHSSEEDTETESVFRPADYDFPLTRQPRESFRLASDGISTKSKASPADCLEETQGEWKLANNVISFSDRRGPTHKRVIISIDARKLVFRK